MTDREPWKASVPQWEPEQDDEDELVEEDWPEHLAGPEYWMFRGEG